MRKILGVKRPLKMGVKLPGCETTACRGWADVGPTDWFADVGPTDWFADVEPTLDRWTKLRWTAEQNYVGPPADVASGPTEWSTAARRRRAIWVVLNVHDIVLIIIWSRDTRLTILIIFREWISQDNLSVARDRKNLPVLILNLLSIRDVIIYNLMASHSYHNTCGNIWKMT